MLRKQPSVHLLYLWQVYAFLSAAILITDVIVLRLYLPCPSFIVYGTIVGISIAWLLTACGYLPLRFRHMDYIFTNQQLTVHDGALLQSKRHIPIQSISYVTLYTDIPQRLLGIASLRIYITGHVVCMHGLPLATARLWQRQLLHVAEVPHV